MATLRVAFLSALALELTAAVATALVAVEIGLRLLAGHVGYQTALLVLLLTPDLRHGKVVQRGSYAECRRTALSGRW